MKYFKLCVEIYLLLIISLCAFGGGLICFGLPILFIFQPSPIVSQIITVVSIFLPMPFAWWLAPKLSDKIL